MTATGSPTDGHFRIKVSALIPGKAATFDVYVLIAHRLVHYLRAGDALSKDKIHALEKADVFYVPLAQKSAFKAYVSAQMRESTLDPRSKAALLRESSLSLAEDIFANSDVGSALEESRELIDQFITFMGEEPEAMSHLISLSAHDFYTYNHSLDVGIYSLGLGRIVGYANEHLVELGRGALFHDIGKRHVKVEIICKNGPLDEVEWAQMQKHPQYGLKILSDYGCTDEMKACCFEHHESFLGNGYPQQLSGEEIHPMARIVAITDTFDALTTKRSYNDPMLPSAAVEFITNKIGAKYDPELVRALNSVLFRVEAAAS